MTSLKNNHNLQQKVKRCPFVSQIIRSNSTITTPLKTSSYTSSEEVKKDSFSVESISKETQTSSDSEPCEHSKELHIDYENIFKKQIDRKLKDESYRYFNNINRLANKYPEAISQKDNSENMVTVWCSNDYLGQSQNKIVCNAMKDAVDKFGTGAGGTRNIAGNSHSHLELEKELARLHKKENALLFSSCYVANDSTLSTLGKMLGKETVVYSDQLNHASIISGLKTINKRIFNHNDPEHLEALIKKDSKNVPKIIVFESVYSMNGNIGKIKEIVDIAKKYNCITFLDEVHAVGLYGKNGAGVAEHLDFYNPNKEIMKNVDIISGTLGKAYGVIGGYIAGSKNLVDMIRSYAPGFIFTTSLPPPIAYAALASVKYLKNSSFERVMQQLNTKYIKAKLVKNNIPIIKNESHIIPVLVGDAKMCKFASDMLINEFNIYVQSINYPTVEKGKERLRITPGPAHSVKMANFLNDALLCVWNRLNLKYTSDWLENGKNKEIAIELENDPKNIYSIWTPHQLSIAGKCKRENNMVGIIRNNTNAYNYKQQVVV